MELEAIVHRRAFGVVASILTVNNFPDSVVG